jgi:hypothetical protein
MSHQTRWMRRNRHRQRIPADGVEDKFDRRSACDLERQRFQIYGPVVDQVIGTGGKSAHMAWRRLSMLDYPMAEVPRNS